MGVYGDAVSAIRGTNFRHVALQGISLGAQIANILLSSFAALCDPLLLSFAAGFIIHNFILWSFCNRVPGFYSEGSSRF